jgi:hypothetical protein
MAFLAAIPAAFAAVAASSATAAQAAIVVSTVATAASAATAGVSAYSSYKQSQFQAKVAQNNAEIAANNAKQAAQAGSVAESVSRMATSRKVGAALAAQGASGVDVASDSSSDLRGALVNEGELDALTIRHNAASNALGFMQQSAGFSSEASLDKRAGRMAAAGGVLNVGSSFIGGASSVASKYASFQQSGAM